MRRMDGKKHKERSPPYRLLRARWRRSVIEVVSEKTGYPADVLDLDMQLDTDLGIDSIKRVEILSALQDRLPSVHSISPELLGTLRTLRSIVEQLDGRRSTELERIADPVPAVGGGPI